MQENRESESLKDKLIEITCAMVEKNGSSHGINMRAVAREAGCAHTNIYNYFGSFSDLLYAAILRTMEKMVRFTQEQVGGIANSEADFSKFIDAQIDFAIEHPGLFRFMWQETIQGEIPESIKEFAGMLKNRFAELVYICAGGKLTADEAMKASIILHGYLYGDISKMISGRELDMKTDENRERIKGNVDRLLRILIEDYASAR